MEYRKFDDFHLLVIEGDEAEYLLNRYIDKGGKQFEHRISRFH